MKAGIPLIAAALFTLSAALLSAEDGFIVPVDRPLKVGDKHKMSIEGESISKMKVNAGGQVVQSEESEWQATVELTRTVNKVDTRGNATELTIEIHKSALTKEGHTADLLPAGTNVKAVAKGAGDKDQFTVNGKAVEEATRDVLDHLIDLSLGENRKGDENKAFGVDQPRKPGEEWEINAAELLATLPPEMPFILDPAATKGKMKFVELAGEGDSRTALLQGEIELNMKSMQGMPPGAKFEGSSLKVGLDGLFPLAKDKPATREGMSMIMVLKASIPTPDGNAKMDGQVTKLRKSRLLP